MKTLNKALDLLEYVVTRNGRPITPSTLAEYYHLNSSTCVRLLKTLCERGYLEQVSRKEGYIAGPELVSLNSQRGIYANISRAAQLPLGEFAKENHCMVNISIMFNFKRFIIYICGYTPNLAMVPNVAQSWNYTENATERLLLSMMSRPEIEKMIKIHGLPEHLSSEKELYHELQQYHQKQRVKFWSQAQDKWVGGFSMEFSGYPPMAIGFGCSQENEVESAIRYGQKHTLPAIKSALEYKMYIN